MIETPRIVYSLRAALVVLLLMLALGISAVRLFLPQINHYKTRIVSSISSSIGKPIEMDDMKGSMNGFQPEVVISGLRILDPDSRKTLLRFEQLRAGLNLTEFLLTGRFQPRWVTIRGAKLSIRRTDDGRISIVGIDSGGEMPKWIFGDGQFELLDSEVDLQHPGRPASPHHFSSVDIRLLNAGDRHKVAVDLDVLEADAEEEAFSMRLDYLGDISMSDCCSGRVYLRTGRLDFGKLLEGFSLNGYSIPAGKGSIQFWGTWEKSVVVDLAGEVVFLNGRLAHRELGVDSESAELGLSETSAWFLWQELEEGWSLSIRRFLLNLNGKAWPRTDFDLGYSVQVADGSFQKTFSASYLSLTDINRVVVGLRMLPGQHHEILQALAPQGEAFDLTLGMSGSGNTDNPWSVCGRFEEMGFNSRGSYPGVKNLSGTVCGSSDSGSFQVISGETEIDWLSELRWPIRLERIKGAFRWTRDEREWSLISDRIELASPDISAQARMALSLPRGEGEPFLDLQVAFEDGNVAAGYKYLPVNTMTESLVDWLDSAFQSGKLTEGATLLRGPLSSFPFRGGEGVFETLFHTKDVVLSYHPDWPSITTDEFEVRFFQAGINIQGSDAIVSGMSVSDFRVKARDLGLDDYLVAEASSEGPISQSLEFVMDTPLASLYKPLLDYVTIVGSNRTTLRLDVPIVEELDDVLVKGAIDLEKVQVGSAGLQLDEARGELYFTHEGIEASGIGGVLLGSQVYVDLSDNDGGFEMHLRGTVSSDSLARRYSSALMPFVKGRTDYQVDFLFPKLTENLYADISFYSDLQGVTVSLPPPLLKSSALPRELTLRTHLQPGKEISLDLVYGDIAEARFVLAANGDELELVKGRIELGRVTNEKGPMDGLGIYARLESLEFDVWNDFFDSLDSPLESENTGLTLVDVQVGSLVLPNADMGPFSLRMRRLLGVWEGFMENRFASGRFAVKTDHGEIAGLDMDLDYLRIPEKGGLESHSLGEEIDWKPQDFPDLNIKAERLFWGRNNYGSLDFATKRQARGMQIDRLNIFGQGVDLKLVGRWMDSAVRQRTSVAGNLNIDSLGDFLRQRGKPGLIMDTRVRSRLSLDWDDPIYDLNAENLSGTARAEFEEGRFLTVEPGIGRLFGLFNLDGLKNLLLLDFGDLFGRGLAFEDGKCAFRVSRGLVKINRLLVNALPAKIIVAGEVDLVKEQLDDIVTVVPRGVIAGASILFDRLQGNRSREVINRKYWITGGWDDPDIVRLPGSRKSL
ncbi:MAG: YhdP family protein [Pseudomonadota bacterium]|nr:YhdP family protein [Pseudomonadota bacterium]